MKVVIITLIKGSFPFIEELSSQLTEKGVEVEVFDMFDMCTLKIVDGKKHTNYHLKSLLLRKVCNIRYFGTLLRYCFYKFYFVLKPLKSDHISIHYVLPFYSFFIRSFKTNAKSVSTCIWGSDFYRISDEKRNKMKPLFDKCDSIIICNSKMTEEFSSFYKNIYDSKIVNSGFGIGKLDLIEKLATTFAKGHLKKNISLPEGKLMVTIGYNGIEAQQHLLVLEAFKNLPKELKNKIFIIIPFGYGGDLIYKNSIKNKLDILRIDYVIFDNFLSDEDVAKIRICTDFVINAQTTDAASASLQEHLYSKNVLLAGEWLPYDYFLNNGIKLWSFNENDLEKNILEILNSFEDYSSQVETNRGKIYELSSWNARIGQWINVFENKL